MKSNKKIITISAIVAVVLVVGAVLATTFVKENKKRWHGKDTHFYMSVSAGGKSGNTFTAKKVEILEDGTVKETEMTGDKLSEENLGKLSEKDQENLFNLVVQTNDFFGITQTPQESKDSSAGIRNIIVKANGKENTISGITPFKNNNCKNILNEVSNLESKLKANKK